jgi:hypothetical protein
MVSSLCIVWRLCMLRWHSCVKMMCGIWSNYKMVADEEDQT